MSNQTPVSYQPLTLKDIQTLQTAYVKLGEHLSSAIATPNKDAEVAGLRQYLANTLLAHADEFIGSWITLNREYQPLLMGMRGLLNRIDDINQREAAQIAAAQTQASADEVAPSNIIQLGGTSK